MSIAKALLAAAAAVFATNPVADEVFVCEDGNAFLPHAKQLAFAHARSAKLPDPVSVRRDQIPASVAVEQAKAAAAPRKKAEQEAPPAEEATDQGGTADEDAADDEEAAADADAEKEAQAAAYEAAAEKEPPAKENAPAKAPKAGKGSNRK
jgi:hypothetical protein